MLTLICVLWIGIKLSAPVWFYVLIGVMALTKTIKLGMDIRKAIDK